MSGLFSAYDQRAFVAFLREFDGVSVDVGQQEIRLITFGGNRKPKFISRSPFVCAQ